MTTLSTSTFPTLLPTPTLTATPTTAATNVPVLKITTVKPHGQQPPPAPVRMVRGGIVKSALGAEDGGCGFYGQVVVGNSAQYLGKKAAAEQTHEWTCYVRGVRPEIDVSPWVARVEFHLHHSFAVPIRTVTAPPFQVTERGWGEFEVAIKVFFADPQEEPVHFVHQLRLYEDVQAPPNPKRLISVERVEEILFSANVSNEFRAILDECSRATIAPKKRRLGGLGIAIDENMLTAPEKAELTTLTVSSKKVLAQIKTLRDAYAAADAETESLRKEIAAAERRLNAKGAGAGGAAATTTVVGASLPSQYQPSQSSQPSQSQPSQQ